MSGDGVTAIGLGETAIGIWPQFGVWIWVLDWVGATIFEFIGGVKYDLAVLLCLGFGKAGKWS